MKRVIARAAGAMAMATKRAMATDNNNTGNGYGKEGGRHLMAATILMGMVMVQRTWPLMLRLERGMMHA